MQSKNYKKKIFKLANNFRKLFPELVSFIAVFSHTAYREGFELTANKDLIKSSKALKFILLTDSHRKPTIEGQAY